MGNAKNAQKTVFAVSLIKIIESKYSPESFSFLGIGIQPDDVSGSYMAVHIADIDFA